MYNHIKKPSVKLKVRIYQAQLLGCDINIELSASSSHHVSTVMRHKEGDYLTLFNSYNGEWLARITTINKKTVTCCVLECLRQPIPQYGACLLFAPIKPHRQAFLIEKATELGVATLLPIISEYSQIRTFNLDKALDQAIEAAEQSMRLSIPTIEAIAPLTKTLNSWPVHQLLLVGTVREDAPLLPDLSYHLKNLPLSFLIGPEGGFSAHENEQFEQYSFIHRFSLGSNILRTETAALACLAFNNMMRI